MAAGPGALRNTVPARKPQPTLADPALSALQQGESAGEIGHHRVEDQHPLGRAAQARIAEPLDEAVFQ